MRRRVERSRAEQSGWRLLVESGSSGNLNYSKVERSGWLVGGQVPGASGLLRHRWPQTPPTTSGKRLVAKKNPNTYE